MKIDINVWGFIAGVNAPKVIYPAGMGCLVKIGSSLEDALKVIGQGGEETKSQCCYEQKAITTYSTQIHNTSDVEKLAYRILHEDLHMDRRAAEMAKAKVAKTIRSRMVVARKDNPPSWTVLLEIRVDCMIEKSDKKEGEPSGEHGYDRLVERLDDGDCPICRNEFGSTGDIVVTTCHHTYHRSCLFKWLPPGTSSCPICRTRLSANLGL